MQCLGKPATLWKLLSHVFIYWFLIIYMQKSYADTAFRGSISKVPLEIQTKMQGKTWHAGCPIPIKDLSFLKVAYWGFDHQVHIGELIVHQRVAYEVLDIFKQLFKTHYQIEKIVIPEKLTDKKIANEQDLLFYLINSNDTYSFFCRADAQTSTSFSAHSFGLAMDINPFYNPMAGNPQQIKEQAGRKYLNRNLQHVGMIKEGDPVFYIFLNHGWKWGGFFAKGADYMHFQKMITQYYVVNRLEYIPPEKRIPLIQFLA